MLHETLRESQSYRGSWRRAARAPRLVSSKGSAPIGGSSRIRGSLRYDPQVQRFPLTTTIGRYQILEKVGQGGMGVVYKAHDTLLERIVALKIISTSIEANPELRERFFREARAAGQLSHRNIITIHDLGEHEGQPYLAMEFLLGEDLQHRLSRQEPMSLRRKLEIASETCEGLSYAHRRGLVHRDVKPANIFITDEGIVKLLDFGLARMVASELTRSNMMMGTLNYMAPEQVRGERTDHRADIFSLGVVLYEIMSGRKAFQGDSFATTLYKILQDVPEPLLNIDPTLPQEVAWLVDKAMAKPKDERYQDLSEMSRDLAIIRQHLSGSETIAPGGTALIGRAPSDPPRTPTPSRASGSGARSGAATAPTSGPALAANPASGIAAPRGRWKLAASLGGAALIAGALYWSWTRSNPGTPDTSPAAGPSQVQQPASSAAPPPVQPPAPAAAAPPASNEPGDAGERSASDARARMASAKAAARQAGPRATRSSAYAAALSAEREAYRLYQKKEFADASAKFYEASGLFRSAELTTTGEARQVPAPPRAESNPAPPQTAPSQGAPPQSGPVQSAPPATGSQSAAPIPPPSVPTAETPVQLPAGAALRLPPPPASTKPPVAASAATDGPASPASSENAIRELIRRYERALESRAVDALRAIWPTLDGPQEEAVRREFQFARRIDVGIEEPAITVSGPGGTAVFVRRYRIVTNDGQILDRNSRVTMTVRRAGGEWVIDRVRFEPIR